MLSPNHSQPRVGTLVRNPVEVVTPAPSARRGVQELGVIAIMLALAAFAITWPFRAAAAGALLGGAGIVFAATALWLVFYRKSSDITLPVLGLLANAEVLVLSAALLQASLPRSEVAGKGASVSVAELRRGFSDSDPVRRAKAFAAVGNLSSQLESTQAELLKALEDPDTDVRRASAESLGQLGPRAKIASAVLLGLAKNDAAESVRQAAERAVPKLGALSQRDIPDFLVALKDPDRHMRSAAALALGKITPPANDAIPALEAALLDSDIGVRVSAVQAIWEISKEPGRGLIPVLIAGVQDKARMDARLRAAATLGAMRVADAKALAALEEAMRDPDGRLRIEAAYALGSIGAPQSAGIFNEALKDPEPKVQLIAAQALWYLAKQTDGVRVLHDALFHRDPDVRISAAVALGKMGREAKDAVEGLGLALRDKDAGVRGRVAEALHHIGPEARAAVPGLIVALQSPDPSFRAQAAFAISGIGADARAAVPQLAKCIADSDAGVRLFASHALWIVDGQGETVLPVLLKVLKEEKDASLRARAASILGTMGSRASSAVPELLDGLFDAAAGVRTATMRALSDIGGPAARATYPAIADLGKPEQPEEVRATAAETLKKIGRLTKADVDTLIAGLNDDQHPRFRATAAMGLWLLNREAKKAVPALSKRLADPDETVRTTVAYALAAMGPEAAPAVPDLIGALTHFDGNLRGRAAFTLGEIGRPAQQAVPALNKLLDGKEPLPVRLQVARALWSITQQTWNVLPVLTKAMEDDDVELNLQAVDTVLLMAAKIPADGAVRKEIREQTMPALSKLIGEERSESVRLGAIRAAGAFGAEARSAVPALLQVLEEEEPEYRALAAESLGKIGASEFAAAKKGGWAKAAYRALLFFSQVDRNDEVQRTAHAALDKIREPGTDDVPTLLAIIHDRQQPLSFRTAAAQVVGMIGPAINPIDLPKLGEIVNDAREAGIRTVMAHALAEVGFEAASQAPALVKCLKEDDPLLRAAAAYALGEIFRGREAPETAAALRALAKDDDENVKNAAATALTKLKK